MVNYLVCYTCKSLLEFGTMNSTPDGVPVRVPNVIDVMTAGRLPRRALGGVYV